MARGIPVVVSEAAGVAEVVREADAGLIVPPDSASLGAAIAALAGDAARLAAMGAAGTAAARERFGWPAVAERMIEAYRAICAARP